MKKSALLGMLGGLVLGGSILSPVIAKEVKNILIIPNQSVNLSYRTMLDRLAIKIFNDSVFSLKYFYVDWFQNGQSSKMYMHNIKNYHSTWDWSWCNATVAHCIELEFNYSKNESIYTVITFDNFDINVPQFKSHIYFRVGEANVLEPFNDKKWFGDEIITNSYDAVNFHGSLDFNNYQTTMSVYWNDKVVFWHTA